MLPRRHLLTAGLAAPMLAPGMLRASGAPSPGVRADRIRIGQVTALTGPSSILGREISLGIAAAFAETNRNGGVAGRLLELLVEDDGYEPIRSIAATRKLLDEDEVFALIGACGTPTSAAALPLAVTAGAPFLCPFTGADWLRTPYRPNVVNLRASYAQETEAIVAHLVADLGATRIAAFYQDDAYGRTGLQSLNRALAVRGIGLVAEGSYERNTLAVKGALLSIRKGQPDAVVMIGTYGPAAEFIRLARSLKLAGPFLNLSMVGTEAFAAALGAEAVGVVVTQVVPSPADAGSPVVANYQAALHAQDPKARFGYASLEGYLAGVLTTQALRRLGGDITRDGMLAMFAQGAAFDLGGMKLRYAPGQNSGGDRVYLSQFAADGSSSIVDRLSRSNG